RRRRPARRRPDRRPRHALGGRAAPPGRPAGHVRPLPRRPVPELGGIFRGNFRFSARPAGVESASNAAAVGPGVPAGFSLPLSSGSDVRPAQAAVVGPAPTTGPADVEAGSPFHGVASPFNSEAGRKGRTGAG